MLEVLLVVHLIACIALVISVMLQKSEGGALGMGGGGAGGGLVSGRGVAGVLVRVSMGLAALFFITSLTLTRLNTEEARRPSAVEQDLLNQEDDVFSSTSAEPDETSVVVEPEVTPAEPDPFAPVLETPAAPSAPPADVDPVSPTE